MASQYHDDEVAYHENPMTDEMAIEEDEEEADALARFLDDIQAAKNCVKCFNIALLILGAGLTAFSFVGGELLLSLNWLAYAMSGLGIAIVFTTVLGLVGSCFHMFRGILVLYYTLLVFLTLILLVLGGFCFILTDTAVRYVERSFDSLVLDVDADRRSSLTLASVVVDLRLFLYVSGGVAAVLVLLLLVVMANVVRLVTPAKAYSVLLQATNLAIVPLGIALISAGLYVADTAATVEAPFAAFAVFLMGFLVVFFAVVGCIGVTISSRGIIRLYQILIGVLGLLFLAFGLAALVVAGQVMEQLISRWDDIRKVLPPSFSGKYDIGQFEAFVETNLKAVGFMALCSGIVLFVQLWAAGRLRQELKRMNELENQVDERFASLANTVGELQEAEKAHRAARREMERAGTARAAVNVLAATMAEECQREFEQLADSLEAMAELEEWDDVDMERRLAVVPSKWDREGPLYKALRTAEWDKVRLYARKLALEEEIESLDAARLEDEGAGGMAEAQRRMSVKKTGGDEGSASPSSPASGKSIGDRFSVPKRRDRPMNAGALFWKRWWTKGTPGSRRAVICCCLVLTLVIVAILGVATASLYFATSCATLAGVSSSKSFPDLESQQFWVDTRVRRGAFSLEPAAVAAPKLSMKKSAFQEGMISSTYPEPAPDTTPPDGSSPRPGVGVSLTEAPPTRFLSFDIACQTADATFQVPQRSTTSSSASASTSSGGGGSGSSSRALLSGGIASLSPAARERASDVRTLLSSRLLRPSASSSSSSSSSSARELQAASPIEQANNNNPGDTSSTTTQSTPGAWLPVDLVSAVVDAVESASAVAAEQGSPFTVAPEGQSPELRARLLGNLATVAMDWTATAMSARPFTRTVRVQAVSSSELTGVLAGGTGAEMTTELGDVGVADGAVVCDPALLGSGAGGLRLLTSKGTVSLLNSVVYNCDVSMTGEASLVRVVNSILMNENGGSTAVLSGTKGSLLVEKANVERISLQGREGSARVLSTEVRETLRVSTTTGNVRIDQLVAGPRAVVQIETGEGGVVLHAKQFQGIVSIVTSGSVTCAGDGLHTTAAGTNPCASAARDANGLVFVEEARVNCVTGSRNDCAYRGEVTVVSNTGSISLTFDAYDETAASS